MTFHDKVPTTLTYGGNQYMILSSKNVDAVQKAVIDRDKTPKLTNIELYKELGINPSQFGYYDGTWEYWLKTNGGPTHTGVTLTGPEVESLRSAYGEVFQILRAKASSYNLRYSVPRLSSTSQQLFAKIGIRPLDLGISAADTWTNY